MPELTLTYAANAQPHNWNHVQTPLEQVRTWANTTKLDYLNLQDNGIRTSKIRSHANVENGRFKIRNETGGTLSGNDLIYLSGTYSDGTDNYPTAAKADSTAALATNYFAIAIVDANISNNADGTALLSKEVSGLNTSGSTVGNPVYLSSTAGGWTLTRPTSGEFIQVVGYVSVVHASSGRIVFDLSQCAEEYLTGQAGGLGYMLDADHDSYLYASADDTVKLKVGGTDVITSTATVVTIGGTVDINGAADISGDLTLSAGGDGALVFSNAGENSIKIPDNQASSLIIEEANNAYLTFVTTNSGEKITLGQKLEAGSVEIEGSAFDINGGAIDGTAIGAASASTGAFTSLSATTDVSVGDDLLLTSSGSVINWNSGDITLTHTAGKLTWGGDGAVELDFNNHEITNVDIDSGAIDGTTVGASSASTGAFTTLSATGDVSFDGGTFVFNEAGADKDFRIEGDGKTHLFFADASTDRIGILTDTPDSVLDVTGDDNSALIGMIIQNIGRHSVELRMHATGPLDGGDYSFLVGGQNGGYKDEWGLYDNNASAFRVVVESDGGVFMNALLAASASTDVNINGSNELHSVTSSGVYKEDYTSGTGSDRVMDLQPRTFTWRHPVDAPDGWAQQVGEPGRRDFGLIAEEVAEVMPELVNFKDGKPYSVRYQMMSVLLLEQLQELKDEIESLKKTA